MKYVHKVTGQPYVEPTGGYVAMTVAEGMVRVHPQGGGFGVTLPLSELRQVEQFPADIVEAHFVPDWCADDFGSLRDAPRGIHVAHRRWNGWAMPMFTRQVIESHSTFEQNLLGPDEQPPQEYDGIDRYQWRGCELYLIGCEGDEDSLMPKAEHNGIVYHSCGDGWCWDAYTEQEIAEREQDEDSCDCYRCGGEWGRD